MTAATDTRPRRGTRAPRPAAGRMSLTDHLRELRRRVVICAVAITAGGSVGWIYYNQILNKLQQPIFKVQRMRHTDMVALNFGGDGVTGAFSVKFKVALFVGLLIASPIWIYQLWAFIVPALKRREKLYTLGFLAAAVPLFALGAGLAWLSFPKAVTTLLDLTPTGGSNFTDAESYLTFITRFVLAFGLAFLLPVLIVGLNMAHVLPSRVLLKGWRISIFLIAVFAAVMTPSPDAVSMIVMAIPMVALFFLALGICLLSDRRRAKRDPFAGLSDDEASAL